MSSFLSNKFLQRREALRRSRTIDHDWHCPTCGYNLRGLTLGRNCPECGQSITKIGMPGDPLCPGEPHKRTHVWLGLTLLAGVLVAVSLLRVWLFIALVFLGWPGAERAYLILGAGLALTWIVGVFLLTPRAMESAYPQLWWLRRAARWSQLLWLPGYVLWIMAVLGPLSGTAGADVLQGWSVLFRGLAGVGALFVAAWLMQLAVDAELEDAARWMNLSIWMLPIPSLLLANLPAQMQWIFLVLIGMVLLTWCWFVLLWGRAVWVMQRHVGWAMRHAVQAHGRDARINEMRTHLQQEAESQVRPLGTVTKPAHQPSTDVDRSCPQCRYNLRGLQSKARCPECGWSPV